METHYECCVCLEEVWTAYTPCRHLLCLGCLLKLVNKKCPLCKSDLTAKLPAVFLDIVKKSSIEEDKNKIDINDEDDFPPLGQ